MSNEVIFNFKEKKYNLTKEYCANIEQHTNDSIYSEIENEVIQTILFRFVVSDPLKIYLGC